MAFILVAMAREEEHDEQVDPLAMVPAQEYCPSQAAA
jgi:hypothetical protein